MMKKIPLYLASIPLLLGLLFTACKDEKAAPPPMVPDVNVVAAGKQTVPVYTDYVGETFGISDVNIRSRLSGYVVSMHFKEGQTVQKGQLLYVVDDRNIQTKIDAAEAQLAEAKTYMVRAKSDLDRVEPLANMNALSKRDLDAAVANYNATRAQVAAAEAGLRNAKIDLSFTRITSPITGIIGLSKVLVGDFVTQGAMGEPMNTVSAIGEMRVRFPVAEAEYLRFAKRGREIGSDKTKITEVPVELVLGDNSMYNETGRMDLANRQVDPETGSLTLQAVFKNENRILRPGQYVKVRFKTDEYKDAIMVPQSAVNQLQGIYQVFVVNDSSKLVPKVVVPGARVGSNWIINSGLAEGEKVAIIGNAGINPKNPVNPIPVNWNYDSTSRKQ
jgi:membrane fusion protein (multidrug efflux system)